MTQEAAVPEKKCPICGKPAVEEFRPFCSKRCADVDLNRWLKGTYVIPGARRRAPRAGRGRRVLSLGGPTNSFSTYAFPACTLKTHPL